jgi:hypothetical protein
VEEASLVEAFVDLFLFVIVTSTSTCDWTADGKSN